MMTFAEMMAAQADLDKGVEDSLGSSHQNDSFPVFKLTYNSEGATYAKIRLLPPGPNGGRFVFKWREHSIDKPRFMSTTCPTTFGQHCPVCEKGWEYHHEGNAEMRSKLVGAEKYACFILVLDDKINPANNGKIMLYKYGRMIAKMIEEKLKPQFGEEPVNVFRLDSGCDLTLRAKKIGSLPKFDGTSFGEPCAVKPPNGEKLEDMWNRIPSLEEEFISKVQPTDENKLISIMKLAMGEVVEEASAPVREPTAGGMPRPKPNADQGINTALTTTGINEDAPHFNNPVNQGKTVKAEPVSSNKQASSEDDVFGDLF